MRLASLAALFFLFTGTVSAADLTIKVTDVNSNKGHIIIAVDDALVDFSAFSGDVAAVRYRAVSGESSVTLSNIPEGLYAVSVIHDENGNSELDIDGQMPVEGYGYSGAGSPYKQPEFSNAAMDVRKPATTITVKMIYLN